MTREATERAFRQFEAILDSHYRTLPFFSRPAAQAVYTLLATFDSLNVIEPFISPDGPYDMNIIQKRRSWEEGLSQSLRWFLGGNPRIDLFPTADAAAMDEAYRFIDFAGQYNIIEGFHILYGKNWVNIAV